MLLSPKTRLGAYEILGPLGAGGMGEVYRAKDLRLGREIAVKVLPSEVASNPERLARFEREARTVAGLNHPNIVTLFSVEDADGIRFLTMELVEGQSLDRLVTAGGLPITRVLELTISLADALVAAHEKGIIHRDLKPGNVMVTHDGRLKVLDFGLAKTAVSGDRPADDSPSVTATGTAPISLEGQVLGTVPYMAPEQVRGEVVDARADLFALGIILYEITVGRRPFEGSTTADLSSSILRDTPVPAGTMRAGVPQDLDRIISRCLVKDRHHRVQAAKDVRNDLERLRREVESGTASDTKSVSLSTAAARTVVPSIAVLPFTNRSHDEEDEYFSDGLTDELLNVLAKIRGLRVAARTSSFHFKGKDPTIAEVGSALNVATVLEGSVRKSGKRVRVSVQLVKVTDGFHLWAEVYDRSLDDIFAVQDDIAQSVVKELRTTLIGEAPDSKAGGQARVDVAAAAIGRGQNAEAHRLYLQGRYFIDRLTREDTARGIGYLQEALGLDPSHALAWTELSGAFENEAELGWVSVTEGYARARDAVERALALEPNLAEAHAALGSIQRDHDRDWKGAEISYRRALDLSPGNAQVLREAGILARDFGRTEEAIRLLRRAVEQDPLSSASYTSLGLAYNAAGLSAEAERALRKGRELAPHRALNQFLLALVLLDQGRPDEARVEAELEPEEAYRFTVLSIIDHAEGRQAKSDEELQKLVENHADEMAYQIAQVHASRREPDAAFEWLDRAYTQGDPGLSYMKPEPLFRPLHGDPRWNALLERMGLAD